MSKQYKNPNPESLGSGTLQATVTSIRRKLTQRYGSVWNAGPVEQDVYCNYVNELNKRVQIEINAGRITVLHRNQVLRIQ